MPKMKNRYNEKRGGVMSEFMEGVLTGVGAVFFFYLLAIEVAK